MTILKSTINPQSKDFQANQEAMSILVADLEQQIRELVQTSNWLGLGRPRGAHRPQKIDKNPKISENFQTLPNASERIRMHPNASEQVRMGPNRSEHVQKLRKTCKNCRKFAKVSKQIAQRGDCQATQT